MYFFLKETFGSLVILLSLLISHFLTPYCVQASSFDVPLLFHNYTTEKIPKSFQKFNLFSCAVLSYLVSSDSLWPRGLEPTRLLCPWDSPGKKTGVDCYAFLQGIFLTQGLKLDLPYCRLILYHLSHQRSPSYFWLEIYLSILLFLFLARTCHFSSLADVLWRLYHPSEGWALQTCSKFHFLLECGFLFSAWSSGECARQRLPESLIDCVPSSDFPGREPVEKFSNIQSINCLEVLIFVAHLSLHKHLVRRNQPVLGNFNRLHF